jgi:hypothetical protein
LSKAPKAVISGMGWPRPSHSPDMNFVDFKALHQRLQLAYLAHHGQPLAARREDSFELTLYAVGDFYAETWQARDEADVLFVHVFQKPAGLSDYLKLVRLPVEW